MYVYVCMYCMYLVCITNMRICDMRPAIIDKCDFSIWFRAVVQVEWFEQNGYSRSAHCMYVLYVCMKDVNVNCAIIVAVLPKPKNASSVSLSGSTSATSSSATTSSVTFKLLSRDAKGRIESRQLLVPQVRVLYYVMLCYVIWQSLQILCSPIIL